MTTHVFVVDSNTFKVHLEHMFAGTGAKDKSVLFLTNSHAIFNATSERNLVGMIADISRIRVGDNIIFYLQSYDGNPGTFFGIFKAESKGFFDDNDAKNYLKDDLDKGLSFRVSISAEKVFSKGITEHEYLDSLSEKEKPYQLCWSMIYRKLKGNRGCTMITSYEAEDLFDKLSKKNGGVQLTGNAFSFDSTTCEIVKTNLPIEYIGRKDSLDIFQRLMYRASKRNAFETHLQAYILQNLDTDPLSRLILSSNSDFWVGNEVSCGVGMQRIDILVIEETDNEVHLRILELKDEEPYDSILDSQLPWYVEWISQYMVPNFASSVKQVYIHPEIIAKKTSNKRIIDRIRTEKIKCSVPTSAIISSTKYIAFEVDTDIRFISVV